MILSRFRKIYCCLRQVASVSMELGGGQLPLPHFLEESTKRSDILSVLTPELLLITLKSHKDSVSAPPLFLENDAPVKTKEIKNEMQIYQY